MLHPRSKPASGRHAPTPGRRATARAVGVLPLALLSAAWTASLTSGAQPSAAVAAPRVDRPSDVLPDGSSVPTRAVEAPASVSAAAGGTTGSVGGVDGDPQQIVATSSTNGIPSAALAAYQRAETVINAADRSCGLQWQLVAAIGRVESDHGRFGSSVLDADGTARPGIVGLALDGKGDTALVRDTDAGQYDGDKTFDRAVGPMQFIPSTWSVVGVDADNDGLRNPQDIDDAALATAVYLCAGSDDLATADGLRSSVYRYNHSESYVDLVSSITNAYLDGDFMSVPNGVVAAGYLTPAPTYVPPGRAGSRGSQDHGAEQAAEPAASVEEPTHSTHQAPQQPTHEPTEPPKGHGPSSPLPPVAVPVLPSTDLAPVDEVLTLAQAIVQCTLDGHLNNLLRDDDPFDLCVTDRTHEGGGSR